MDRSLINDYDTIIKTLQILFNIESTEIIKNKIRLCLTEDELAEYVKNTILLIMGDEFVPENIYKIDILPNKKISIDANGHFDPDENYSCLDTERYIAKYIEIFTGYKVDISL